MDGVGWVEWSNVEYKFNGGEGLGYSDWRSMLTSDMHVHTRARVQDTVTVLCNERTTPSRYVLPGEGQPGQHCRA